MSNVTETSYGRMLVRIFLLGSSGTISLSIATAAAAQTAPVQSAPATVAAPDATAPAPVADTSDSSQIGEIVVTAQRREEGLQKVPLSVTAITGSALKSANITDAVRLEQLTPGLRIGRSGSDIRPAIRGVFTDQVQANSDPRIGFYVDDVYQSRTSQALSAFVDLERVEVQKGPQCTLYGRNSFGGNIAVFSAVPKDVFSAGVDLTYGRFDRARAEGFVNLPVTDGIAFRLSGSYDRMDPYIKNTSTGSSLGDEDAGYVRGILKIAPAGSGLDVQLRASYYRQGGAGVSAFGYKSIGTTVDPSLIRQPGGSITLPNGRVLTFPDGYNGASLRGAISNPIAIPFNSRFRDGIPDIGGADLGVPIESDPYRINFDAIVRRKTEQKQFSAAINYEFDFARIRSITSYNKFYANRQSDNDLSSAPLAIDSNLTRTRTFTQELQLLSNDRTSPFQWIVGGYYFNDRVEEAFFSDNFQNYPVAGQPALSAFSPTLLPGAAFPNNAPITNARSDNFSPVLAKTKSYAGFAQLSYTFWDRLTVTGGYRYTSDRKKYAAGIGQAAVGGYFNFDLKQPVNYSCSPTGGVLLGNNPANATSTASNSANALGIQCGQRDFNYSTWRGAVDFKITPQNLLYGSVSRGVHSGGFNNVLAQAGGQVQPFDSETVTAFEIGTKNRFAQGRVQLNAALFYNDFKDLQVQTGVTSPNGLTVLSVISNGGKSRAYGAEIEAIVKPTPRMTIQLAFNYLNARDTEFITTTGANGLCGVVAGGCPAVPLPSATASAAEIAAYNTRLLANSFGVGPLTSPFPNPQTDPGRFQPVFLANGAIAPQAGGTLPVLNYIIAGRSSTGNTKYKQQTVFSPDFTIQAGFSYDFDLAGGRLTPSVQSYFSSSFINNAFTPYFGNQKAFTRTDLRVSWTAPDNKLTLQAYVENIEDEAVLNRVAFGANRSLNGVYGLPRTYGIKAGYRF